MNFSLAPMEGITGFITRNAFHHHFDHIDKYYTPFIPAAERMNKKIIRDILPENNQGIVLIPQIMSNKSEEVIYLANQLKDYGYDTLNVNLGCPSGTVVSKKRGSGFLTLPDELDRFLYELYSQTDFNISIKTRIGFNDEEEWPRLLEIYSKYPMPELIIHPRLQKDFYKNATRLDSFRLAVDKIDINQTQLWYNGDITSVDSFQKIQATFPEIDSYMIGRGLYAHPGLIGFLDTSRNAPTDANEYRKTLRAWHDEIINGYIEIFKSEKDAMFHMKEIWSYLYKSFNESDKYLKKLRKSQIVAEYKMIVSAIFNECELVMF